MIPFLGRLRHKPVPSALTALEVAQVRELLREFAMLKHSCPTARRLLDPD